MISKFYLDRDNKIIWSLYSDKTPIILWAVTKFTLHIDGKIFDSTIDTEYFEWDTEDNKLILNLGQSDIKKGVHKVRLTLFDAVHFDGISFEENLYIRAFEEIEVT